MSCTWVFSGFKLVGWKPSLSNLYSIFAMLLRYLYSVHFCFIGQNRLRNRTQIRLISSSLRCTSTVSIINTTTAAKTDRMMCAAATMDHQAIVIWPSHWLIITQCHHGNHSLDQIYGLTNCYCCQYKHAPSFAKYTLGQHVLQGSAIQYGQRQ